jgi:hypothetical protein
LHGVLVIAAQVIQQGHESSCLIFGESRGGGEQQDQKNQYSRSTGYGILS